MIDPGQLRIWKKPKSQKRTPITSRPKGLQGINLGAQTPYYLASMTIISYPLSPDPPKCQLLIRPDPPPRVHGLAPDGQHQGAFVPTHSAPLPRTSWSTGVGPLGPLVRHGSVHHFSDSLCRTKGAAVPHWGRYTRLDSTRRKLHGRTVARARGCKKAAVQLQDFGDFQMPTWKVSKSRRS